MNTDNLKKKFADVGLELVIAKEPLSGGVRVNRRGTPPPAVEIIQFDIKRKFKGNARSEYFILWPGHEDNLVQVMGVDKDLAQLVLLFKEPAREFIQTALSHEVREYNRLGKSKWCAMYGARVEDVFIKNGELKVKRKTTSASRYFLAGRDERQLFMTQLSVPCTSVMQAHAALKTNDVFTAEGKVGRATRQGEWFFLMPSKEEDLAISNYLKNKMAKIHKKVAIGTLLGRPGGKPHTADEVISFSSVEPVLEHGFQVRPRNSLFVRGKVRHSDHKTVEFKSWRKIMGNAEVASNSGGVVLNLGGSWVD